MRRLALFVGAALVLAACGTDTLTTSADAPDTTIDPSAAAVLPGGPSALDNPRNADLPDPRIDLNRLRSGGPPPDGIPPIDDPSYLAVDEVDFLADVEPVLVLTIGDDTRIFPVQIMTWHEIVNDTIGGAPVTVSYCPLCNSAITYDRRIEIEDQTVVLDFGTSGMLFNSALVMYDRQTESLWSHFTGEAVVGVLVGAELDVFPTATVGWATARAAHPDAQVLSRDTGFSRDYGRNPYGGYDDVTSSPFLYDGDVDGRLAAKERVIGIEADQPVAVRTEAMPLPGVVDVEVDGDPVTVWRVPGTASALDSSDIADGREVGATGVFRRTIDGRVLTFRVTDDGHIVDDETGSTWTILGRATSGPFEGARLEALPHVDTFWFAWAAFLPDTTVV